MNEKSFLALWIEAPLQSWGADSKFYRRETLEFPTKSGILGLICCAMGKGGEQSEFLSEFKNLSQTVLAFEPSTSNRVLYDFQTVGNGYDDKDEWQKGLIPKTTEGKSPTGSGSKLIFRAYLQNKSFGVVLEVPHSQKDEIIQGLTNPVWDIYFGRKNCAPTDFIYRGEYTSIEEAKYEIGKIADQKQLSKIFEVVDGDDFDEGESFTLNDVPLQFGEYKKYTSRRVTKYVV